MVFTLYWYEAQMGFPSFDHETETLGLPAYVHTSLRGRPTVKMASSSFLMKRTGSEGAVLELVPSPVFFHAPQC